MASATSSSRRDWGKGMACVGRTRECTIVPANHFGPIPGVPVGTMWRFRVQVSADVTGFQTFIFGVCVPYVAGAGNASEWGSGGCLLGGGCRVAARSFIPITASSFMVAGLSHWAGVFLSGTVILGSGQGHSSQEMEWVFGRVHRSVSLVCIGRTWRASMGGVMMVLTHWCWLEATRMMW